MTCASRPNCGPGRRSDSRHLRASPGSRRCSSSITSFYFPASSTGQYTASAVDSSNGSPVRRAPPSSIRNGAPLSAWVSDRSTSGGGVVLVSLVGSSPPGLSCRSCSWPFSASASCRGLPLPVGSCRSLVWRLWGSAVGRRRRSLGRLMSVSAAAPVPLVLHPLSVPLGTPPPSARLHRHGSAVTPGLCPVGQSVPLVSLIGLLHPADPAASSALPGGLARWPLGSRLGGLLPVPSLVSSRSAAPRFARLLPAPLWPRPLPWAFVPAAAAGAVRLASRCRSTSAVDFSRCRPTVTAPSCGSPAGPAPRDPGRGPL